MLYRYTSGMDNKSQVTALLQAHRSSIDDLHQKLAAVPGVQKEQLAKAVVKYKAAVAVFEDDAQDSVVIGGG